jgi:hypothetical protein
LKEGGGVSERILNVLLGTAELGLTSRFPGSTAASGAAGAGAEALTGDRESGDIAEVGLGVGQSAATLGKAGLRGAKRLFGGETAEEMVTKGLGAERTAQDVGGELQLPPRPDRAGGPRASQAQKAITRTAEESSEIYGRAGSMARQAGAKVPGTSPLLKTAREAVREAKRANSPLTGEALRAVKAVMRLGRGQKSKLVTATGGAASRGVRDMPVDELIEAQSNLRNAINGLPKDDRAKTPLIALSKAIDDAMGSATQGTAVGETLDVARDVYRRKTIPTRTTAARVQGAETPEQAARMVTSARTPSRFERMTTAVPESAEGLRSAAFNDMVQGAMKGEKLDMRKLADTLEKAEASGQLANLADTPGRRLTIKAVRKAAAAQRVGEAAPVGGLGVGAVGGGLVGLGTGYAVGKLVQAGMTSERAGRALFRLASAKRGSPGWKSAAKVLKAAVDKMGPAARAGIAVGSEEE